MSWGTIIFWVAIVLLSDAAFGLWNHDRFFKIAPKINIFKIALFEVGVAGLLMIVHYFF